MLALDVGEARVGLARGERGTRWAFGRGALPRSGHLAQDVAAILEVARAEGADRIVVGLPVRAQGGDSVQTGRVRAFADALRAHGWTVDLVDERFTTALAARQLRATGLPRRKRQEKGRLDEGAAVAILETYLAQPTLSSPDSETGAG